MCKEVEEEEIGERNQIVPSDFYFSNFLLSVLRESTVKGGLLFHSAYIFLVRTQQKKATFFSNPNQRVNPFC